MAQREVRAGAGTNPVANCRNASNAGGTTKSFPLKKHSERSQVASEQRFGFTKSPKKREYLMNFKTTALVSIVTLGLSACGGGGGGSSVAAPESSTTPPAQPAVTNVFKAAYDGGIYILSGYGLTLNGTPQIVIGKETIDSVSQVEATKATFGAVSSPETLPTLFPQINEFQNFYTPTGTIPALSPRLLWGSDPASVEVAPGTSNTSISSVMKWKATLQARDISGSLVSDSIRQPNGNLVTEGTFANPLAVFPAGSIAYTTTLQAENDMYLQYGRIVFAINETELLTTYSCKTVPGIAGKLIIAQVSAGIIKYSETTTGNCSRIGEVPLAATGTWVKSTLNNDNIYVFTHSAEIMSGKWASLFAGGISPNLLATNVIYERPANSGLYYSGYVVRVGETFVAKQAHFNAAALPGLRSLSGV
jgi:hypothetical protein